MSYFILTTLFSLNAYAFSGRVPLSSLANGECFQGEKTFAMYICKRVSRRAHVVNISCDHPFESRSYTTGIYEDANFRVFKAECTERLAK